MRLLDGLRGRTEHKPGTPTPSPSGARTGHMPVIDVHRAAWVRRWVFIYDLVMFAVLAFLAWSYFQPVGRPWSIGGLVPEPLAGIAVYSFWFGALGGVVISLKGIYDHGTSDWQPKYNLWHVGRPISGGIAGAVTYVLLLAVSGPAPTQAVVLAAAFIIGTQERRFFNLLSEVARIVLQVPGEADAVGIMVTEIHPSEGSSGTELAILGRGFDPGAQVWVGNARLGNVVVNRDGTSISGTVPAGTGEVEVRIENPDGAARVVHTKFTYQDGQAPSQASSKGSAPHPAGPLTATDRTADDARQHAVALTGTGTG